jgi:hypothetical protein
MRLTQEHDDLRRTVRRWIETEANPNVDEWEAAGIFPAHEVFASLGALGLLGVTKPEAFGGLGLDYSFSAVLAEELGHMKCAGVPMAIGVQTDMCTPALARHGRSRRNLDAACWKWKERTTTPPSAKPGERLPVPAQRDDSPRQGGNTPRHGARRTGGRRVEKEDHLRWLEQLRESQRLTTREEERKEKVLEILREIAETSAQLGSGRGGRRQRSPTPSMSLDSQRPARAQEGPEARPARRTRPAMRRCCRPKHRPPPWRRSGAPG